MERKKTMVCLAGAALVVGLVVVLCLALRPGTSKAVTFDPGDCQTVSDHVPSEIEEIAERGSIDGCRFRQIGSMRPKQPEAVFKVMAK